MLKLSKHLCYFCVRSQSYSFYKNFRTFWSIFEQAVSVLPQYSDMEAKDVDLIVPLHLFLNCLN